MNMEIRQKCWKNLTELFSETLPIFIRLFFFEDFGKTCKEMLTV